MANLKTYFVYVAVVVKSLSDCCLKANDYKGGKKVSLRFLTDFREPSFVNNLHCKILPFNRLFEQFPFYSLILEGALKNKGSKTNKNTLIPNWFNKYWSTIASFIKNNSKFVGGIVDILKYMLIVGSLFVCFIVISVRIKSRKLTLYQNTFLKLHYSLLDWIIDKMKQIV